MTLTLCLNLRVQPFLYPVTNPGYLWVLDSANHIDLKKRWE